VREDHFNQQPVRECCADLNLSRAISRGPNPINALRQVRPPTTVRPRAPDPDRGRTVASPPRRRPEGTLETDWTVRSNSPRRSASIDLIVSANRRYYLCVCKSITVCLQCDDVLWPSACKQSWRFIALLGRALENPIPFPLLLLLPLPCWQQPSTVICARAACRSGQWVVEQLVTVSSHYTARRLPARLHAA
jgi:hypothetical protein